MQAKDLFNAMQNPNMQIDHNLINYVNNPKPNPSLINQPSQEELMTQALRKKTEEVKQKEQEAEIRFKNWQPVLYSMPEFLELSNKGKQNAIETLKNNPEKFFEVIKQTPYYQQLSDKGKERLKESLFNPVKYRQEKINAPTIAEKHGLKYEGDSANPEVYIDPTGWAGVGAFMGLKAIPGVVAGDLVGEATKYIANKGENPYQKEENVVRDYVVPLAADIVSGIIGGKIYEKLPDTSTKLLKKLVSNGQIEKAKQLLKREASNISEEELNQIANIGQKIVKETEEVKQPQKEVVEVGADVVDEANQQVNIEDIVSNITPQQLPKPSKKIKTLQDAISWFESNLLNKEIETPIGLKVRFNKNFFLNAISAGKKKGFVEGAKSPEESYELIKSGISEDKIQGYQHYRARDMYLIPDILQSPHIVTRDKEKGYYTFYKEYQVNGTKGYVSVIADDEGNIRFVSFHKKGINTILNKIKSGDEELIMAGGLSRGSATSADSSNAPRELTASISNNINQIIKTSSNNFKNLDNQQVRQNIKLNSGFSKLPNEDITIINKEIESFNKQLIDFAQNKLPPNTLLKLGKPKSILKSIGFPDLDFTINPKTLRKKIKKHQLNIEDIKDLPKEINDPLIVYKLSKEKNVIIATAKRKNDGILLTAVKVNTDKSQLSRGVKVNDIRSIYFKDFNKFLKHLEILQKEGNVFYLNKEKATTILPASGGTIPPRGQYSDNLINNLEQNFKKTRDEGKKLYAGIPTTEVAKAFSKLDELIYKKLTSKIEDTSVDNFLRKYLLADKYGLGSISRKTEDKVINDYIKLKAHLARGDISAEKKEKILNKYLGKLEEGKKKVIEKLMIQYLENPTIRDRVKKELPQVAQNLDQIRKEIDRLGKLKMERGLITPSQFLKWRDKYLTRLYVMDENIEGLDITKGIKQYEEKKGRKIESIVDFIEYLKQKDPMSAEEWEKKAILDPIKAVKVTLAKSYANLAIDDFYRKVINDSELVPQQYLVELPIDVGKLPKKMSPYYAESKVLPYLRDIYRKTKDKEVREAIKSLRKQINEKKYLIERDLKILENKGYRQLSEKSKARFSVISGLPVHKDIANLIEGMTRIIENPMDTASRLDKWFSTFIAYFKWAKVPGNIFSYPRNFMSNWIQFALSGADPVEFPVYYGKAIKNVLYKDKYYELAKKWGLFHSNLASEEISKIFGELKQTIKPETKPKKAFVVLLKALQKTSEAYGWIDDLAKLARFRYAIEVEKKPIKEAIRIAQDTHFDYGLTYNVIRAMRDPNVDRGVFLKLFGTLFPTYTHKALSFLYDTIIKRPATLSALLAGFYAVKQYIEAQNEKKVGKEKYEKLKKLAPEFLDNPFVIPIVEKDGKWVMFVDPSYIIPFGNIVSFTQDLIQRQPGEAARELGALSNPIYSFKGLHENRDPLTGRPIYYPYDEVEKVKGISKYLFNQFIAPLTIVKIEQLTDSKHPVLQRILTGMLWYEYPESTLKEFKKSKISKIKFDTNYWITPLKKDLRSWDKKYRDGKISKEEFEEKRKEIIEKIKHFRQLEKKAIIEELKKMR